MVVFSFLLTCSMIMPFILYHMASDLTDGIVCSLFLYVGGTKVRSLLEDRKKTGGLFIAVLENLP